MIRQKNGQTIGTNYQFENTLTKDCENRNTYVSQR
jgi:hypothetical protein